MRAAAPGSQGFLVPRTQGECVVEAAAPAKALRPRARRRVGAGTRPEGEKWWETLGH